MPHWSLQFVGATCLQREEEVKQNPEGKCCWERGSRDSDGPTDILFRSSVLLLLCFARNLGKATANTASRCLLLRCRRPRAGGGVYVYMSMINGHSTFWWQGGRMKMFSCLF